MHQITVLSQETHVNFPVAVSGVSFPLPNLTAKTSPFTELANWMPSLSVSA
jgi:hypothetical protein